jgi:hypothetical protein
MVFALLLSLGLLAPNHVLGQSDDAPEEASSVPQAVALPGGAVPTEVQIRVLQVGVGDQIRPGDWAGVLVSVNDSASSPREVLIELSMPDPDGDQVRWQRLVTTSPGSPQRLWISFRAPMAFARGLSGEIRALTIGAQIGASGLPVGQRLLGVAALPGNRTAIRTSDGIIGIIGRDTVGLDSLSVRLSDAPALPLGHEPSVIATTAVSDIPDRWMPLAPIGVLVWSQSGVGNEPTDLSEAQADALTEWVTRGGHLVVVLPSISQNWFARSNPLARILPRVTPDRREAVDLNRYRLLLRSERGIRADAKGPPGSSPPLPTRSVVHVLTPEANAGEGEARVILAGPDGTSEGIVVRRHVGAGAVTMIGIDLASPAVRAAIMSDVFWNRVLGRRGVLISADEVKRRLDQNRGENAGLMGMYREQILLDSGMAGAISKTGAAAAGVLLSFAVFGIYWIVAGPLGYRLLKIRQWTQHAWVAFVLIAGVFTAIAWGGASVIRPRTTEARHLTIIDSVHGQPTARARAWLNVMLPSYNDMIVAIDQSSDAQSGASPSPEARMRNALAPWDSPVASAEQTPFIDTRAYALDARQPDRAGIPSRSTVKALQADWAGPTPWAFPRPTLDAPVVMETLATPRRGGSTLKLSGRLVHELPAPLTDVTIVVVRQQLELDRPPSAQLMFNAVAMKLPRWSPGELLDLEQLIDQPRIEQNAEPFLAGLTPVANRGMGFGAPQTLELNNERLDALSFFPLLRPPEASAMLGESQAIAQRSGMHTYDIARWFTEPGLIVVGHIELAPSPVPMRVDGRPLKTEGRTLVRWHLPLRSNPPRVPARIESESARPQSSPLSPTPAQDRD